MKASIVLSSSAYDGRKRDISCWKSMVLCLVLTRRTLDILTCREFVFPPACHSPLPLPLFLKPPHPSQALAKWTWVKCLFSHCILFFKDLLTIFFVFIFDCLVQLFIFSVAFLCWMRGYIGEEEWSEVCGFVIVCLTRIYVFVVVHNLAPLSQRRCKRFT